MAVLLLALVAALPYVVWERAFPAAVDIVVTADHVTYLFADAQFASEFASKNRVLR